MIQKTITKIKNKLIQRKQRGYLDLTSNTYQNDKKWQYIGLKLVTRPYKKIAMVIAGSMMLCSLILPDLGLGIYGGIKYLGKYG